MHRPARGHTHNFEGRSTRLYDVVARRVLRTLYRRLAADVAAEAAENGSVLDVGTGPGVLLAELARRRPDLRVTGIDLSADMIVAARRNLREFGDRASAEVGDATSLPLADNSFDLIVSSLSLHHWDNPEAAVPELARVLRPGGRVLIYDLPHAPFDRLTTAARANGVLSGQSDRPVAIRTGIPFLHCVRHDMWS